MTVIKVICRECGVVKENVENNGEIAEPSRVQKAQIIADNHEETSDCFTLIKKA